MSRVMQRNGASDALPNGAGRLRKLLVYLIVDILIKCRGGMSNMPLEAVPPPGYALSGEPGMLSQDVRVVRGSYLLTWTGAMSSSRVQ
jgi:hypothetical protein